MPTDLRLWPAANCTYTTLCRQHGLVLIGGNVMLSPWMVPSRLLVPGINALKVRLTISPLTFCQLLTVSFPVFTNARYAPGGTTITSTLIAPEVVIGL